MDQYKWGTKNKWNIFGYLSRIDNFLHKIAECCEIMNDSQISVNDNVLWISSINSCLYNIENVKLCK